MKSERNFGKSPGEDKQTSRRIVTLSGSVSGPASSLQFEHPASAGIDYSRKYKDILLKKSKARRLEASRQQIENSFEKNLLISRLAEEACMSKSYFCREFKRSFGISPHKYIIQCRLSAAEYLLLNSDLSVTYITHAVGFRNRSSFSRLFKEHFQVSPHLFRDRHKST